MAFRIQGEATSPSEVYRSFPNIAPTNFIESTHNERKLSLSKTNVMYLKMFPNEHAENPEI